MNIKKILAGLFLLISVCGFSQKEEDALVTIECMECQFWDEDCECRRAPSEFLTLFKGIKLTDRGRVYYFNYLRDFDVDIVSGTRVKISDHNTSHPFDLADAGLTVEEFTQLILDCVCGDGGGGGEIPDNELITSITLIDGTLTITEAGTPWSIDLSDLIPDCTDCSATNELIQTFVFNTETNVITITDAGGSYPLDLSSLIQHISAGDNVNITGTGTSTDPWVVNAIIPDLCPIVDSCETVTSLTIDYLVEDGDTIGYTYNFLDENEEISQDTLFLPSFEVCYWKSRVEYDSDSTYLCHLSDSICDGVVIQTDTLSKICNSCDEYVVYAEGDTVYNSILVGEDTIVLHYTYHEMDTINGIIFDTTYKCDTRGVCEVIETDKCNLCDLVQAGLLDVCDPSVAALDCDYGGLPNGIECDSSLNALGGYDDCELLCIETVDFELRTNITSCPYRVRYRATPNFSFNFGAVTNTYEIIYEDYTGEPAATGTGINYQTVIYERIQTAQAFLDSDNSFELYIESTDSSGCITKAFTAFDNATTACDPNLSNPTGAGPTTGVDVCDYPNGQGSRISKRRRVIINGDEYQQVSSRPLLLGDWIQYEVVWKINGMVVTDHTGLPSIITDPTDLYMLIPASEYNVGDTLTAEYTIRTTKGSCSGTETFTID